MAKPLLSRGLDSADAAAAWFRNRIPLTDAEVKASEDEALTRAFWVGGVAQMRLVQDVFDGLQSAIENGTTLEDFQDAIGDKLAAAWGGENPYRVENIFRTNIQRAYMAGRVAEMRDPAVKKFRTMWKFDATLDEGTCPICDSCDETVLDADHEFWGDHTPPLHFQCRCTIISVMEEDVDEKDVGLDGDEADPLPGFGSLPDEAGDDQAQQLDGYDSDLVALLRSK